MRLEDRVAAMPARVARVSGAGLFEGSAAEGCSMDIDRGKMPVLAF